MKIKVQNLVKSYGPLEVLKSISFEIREGSIFGFLGRNGAGKTTTMNILTGLIDYNSGEIFIGDKEFKKNRKELMKKIGYMTENPVFYDYMTGYEYLKFIGSISDYDIKKQETRIWELMEMVKLKEAAKRRTGGYSRGMKQRLALAVAIFNNPSILFLDEPTSALDPEGRMEMMDLIANLKGSGITVFLSTHILNDVERVCDEVSILNQGKIIMTKSMSALVEEYIQPIYDIEFEGDSNKVAIDYLNGLDWVEKVKEKDKKISLFIKDMDIAKISLLKELSVINIPVLSYQIRKSNLEDIFIRMVNTDEVV